MTSKCQWGQRTREAELEQHPPTHTHTDTHTSPHTHGQKERKRERKEPNTGILRHTGTKMASRWVWQCKLWDVMSLRLHHAFLSVLPKVTVPMECGRVRTSETILSRAWHGWSIRWRYWRRKEQNESGLCQNWRTAPIRTHEHISLGWQHEKPYE